MAKNEPDTGAGVSTADVQQVLQTETGGRALTGPSAVLLFIVPVCWSLFQLWIASPLPFILDFGIFNSTEARSIHLAFAVFLAYAAFPMIKGKHDTKVPIYDWVLALAAAFAASYLFVFYDELATRPGAPITQDLWVALAGLVLLLEATRRALGLPLTIVAAVFITYSLAGPYMPDVISHKGVSLSKLASHQWLGTEGVFGVALGVSTSFVFLFVLFGALLERAGAGNYFIKMAYSMLGHMRGGPAKAAVVSSGLSGVISGSSIANVVTTGTFTIPLMKRVGFPATKAGAVEVAASTNGQLTPPIMGAAAFLMVEYVGISYLEVIKHAILPALISYVALIYIVHLEACKLNMKGIERLNKPTLAQRMLTWVVLLIGLSVLTFAVYYGVGWVKDIFGEAAMWVLGPLLVAVYVGLVWYATRFPPLEEDDPSKEMGELPEVGPTVKSGLYFLLPVVVLVWCLTVERFSPQLSAFWATAFMIFIVITQRPLKSFFRKHGHLSSEFTGGIVDLFHSLATGARNMIGIGVATATAGIVVGTVTLTGIGLVMTQFVEVISGGNILLMLIFTAIISLILGMGLPTTANYIVVSTLMAPVIVTLGAENGLLVPLIAVHLFVFYFGILADDTPPVGLAAYAAAAISGGDPIRTGVQGFTYDIRTAILPFMFIFNTQLLLIGLTGWVDLLVTIFSAVTAMLVFSAATQGFWFTKTRWWETVLLLLITFTLFRPGFWWDMVYPPTEDRPATEIYQHVEDVPADQPIIIQASGMSIDGDETSKYLRLPLPAGETPEQRLAEAGLELSASGDRMVVDFVNFGSMAEQVGIGFGWTIDKVQVEKDRPPKELMVIPALILLAFLAWGQLRRKKREDAKAQAA
ncbi:TRAP transporter permease [Marinobacter persicus]|uniref:TRAP transporter 4TM/12TM fusion protein n=1 Tax=Marinobacter persicus TaxID=930118 RepID=A0A2S6G389_9GAMM|nr:TRAP transporter permease [Marinobacter persicus]PPK50164.1 TRAP transporter 4TM/12TM fusion protein [Marinobacter persicus]PPK52623.1 TRAP transporter 4TM/12TM fusion protein [Marinobacter persicus]PPK56652.1 TRAP transporter 4TM/12TM fusion protein [Marinobacter persicus]